ncbi:unnamed protein product, partial [marine sediment metagenome]
GSVSGISNLTAAQTETGIGNQILLPAQVPDSYVAPVSTDGLGYDPNIVLYKEGLRPDVERMLDIVFWKNLGRKAWNNNKPSIYSYWTEDSELNYFANRYLDGIDDMTAIENWLGLDYNNNEHNDSETFKTNVIADVTSLLNDYVSNGCDLNSMNSGFFNSFFGNTFADLHTYLTSNVDKTVTLTSGDPDEDLEKIIAYLNSTDLHFGRSAYDSLAAMLGLNPARDTLNTNRQEIAKALILIEILLGILSPNVQEGTALVISMYTLTLMAGAK